MKEKSLKTNAILNVILTVFGIVLPLITFPYFSRILMPEGLGDYNFINSFIAYFAIFASLGIPTYGVRAVAQVKDNKIGLSKLTQELSLIQLFCSLAVYAVLFSLLFFVPRLMRSKLLFFIIGIGTLLSGFSFSWLLSGLEEYKFNTIKSLSVSLLLTLLLFLLVRKKDDLYIYVGLSCGANVLNAFINFIYIQKFVTFKRVDKLNLRKHLKPILIFLFMAVASSVYTNLDNVMLGLMTNDYTVGIYNASIKINRILVSIVTSLGIVLLPRLSKYYGKGESGDFQNLIVKSLNAVLMISVPLVVYFAFFSKDTILFLLSDIYRDSILPMQISNPILIFIGLSNVIGIQMLVPSGKEKLVMYSIICGCAVDLVLNFILIPHYGAAGAAIGTAAAELSVLIFQLVCVRKQLKSILKNMDWKRLLVLSAAAILSVVGCRMFLNGNVGTEIGYFYNILISVSIVGITYLLTLILVKEPLTMSILHKGMAAFCKLTKKGKNFDANNAEAPTENIADFENEADSSSACDDKNEAKNEDEIQ